MQVIGCWHKELETGQEKSITKVNEEVFRSYVHYLDFDVVSSMYMSKLTKLYTLYMFSLLGVNYTSRKVVKTTKRKHNSQKCIELTSESTEAKG